MKLPETFEPSHSHPKRGKERRKGVALVTVLTVMALTTILVLTFFSLASSEHRASNIYSQGLQAQQVGEQAVNFVIAQIREATTAGTTMAWASQPGAIRRWDDGGNNDYAYKLYSDDQMKTMDWSDFQKDFMDLARWSSQPDHFVDLNEPVIRGEKVYYPIVHPSASSVPKWPKQLGEDKDGVEGFSYNQRPGRTLRDVTKLADDASKIAKSRDGHVAMPVKWIYQLADGSLGTLSEGASGVGYRFVPIPGAGYGTASAANPIVARFAFWADDETSKLNINVHAGGLAWDVPKVGGETDMNMGKYQPARNEWQRYPGHPASTHLIPALAPGVLDIVNDRDAMEMLYRVVPRVVGGGSESGTKTIDTRIKSQENGLVADREPLFPTVDDVIMRSDRKPHEFPDPKGRPIPADELSEYLERSKFFITANSRAPETNMFNLPRVAIWPIYAVDYDDPEYRVKLTAFDRLIHYCASMGENNNVSSGYPRYEYIFKRKDADSTTNDYEQIDRNQTLYNYLLNLLETKVPGYGDSFSYKYPNEEAQQILTQIFDYIRTTNLHDDSIFEDFEDAFVADNTSDSRTYTNPRDKANTQLGHKGHGQVVPIRIGNTKGFGRFYTLGSVQVHVISCAEPGDIPLPRNLGSEAYRTGKRFDPSNVNRPDEVIYSNFPPQPAGYEAGGPNEPVWLADLRQNNANLYQAAMEPANWNWQLAFLDPSYTAAVLSSPSANRFNRGALNMDTFKDGLTRLKSDEQLVQGGLYFNLFTPSIGWGSINPDMEIKIEVLNGSTNNFMYFNTASLPTMGSVGGIYNGKARFLGFVSGIDGNTGNWEWIFSTNRTDSAWGGRRYGGLMPHEYTMAVHTHFTRQARFAAVGTGSPYLFPASNYPFDVLGGLSRLTPLDRGYDKLSGLDVDSGVRLDGNTTKTAQSYRYDLVTVPFKIVGASLDGPPSERFIPGVVDFKGGDLKFSFYHGGDRSERSAPNGNLNSFGAERGELIQEVSIEVPSFTLGGGIRGPYGYAPKMYNGDWESYRRHIGGRFNEFDALEKDSFSFLERNSLGADPGNPLNVKGTGARGSHTRISQSETAIKVPGMPSGRFAHLSVHSRPTLFSYNDIVQSVEIKHGDARIVAGRAVVKTNDKIFAPHRNYGSVPMAHSSTTATGSPYVGALIEDDYLIIPKLPYSGLREGPYGYNRQEGSGGRVPLPFGVDKSKDVQRYGDFDNGSGLMIDGPYINKPDEGNIHSLKGKWMQSESDHWESMRSYGEFPYFNRDDRQESGGPAYFSPNRLVSGPGMFGSLPTGVMSNDPWRTLLFRPQLKSGSADGFKRHPGGDSPPDHLIMDLFWMPVVEPYAISEPLSTAGKVNLNFEMVPFLHVQRSTALRGVFRSEFLLCVPNKWHQDYKHNYGRGRGYHWRDAPYAGQLQGKRLRAAIREDDTIEQFFDRFDNGAEIFKSSTEICEIHLVPEEVTSRLGLGQQGSVGSPTPTVAEMDSGQYWKEHSLVGDNSRERSYGNIQTRLTTKSNTFLVHYRAQVLKQARRDSDSDYGEWRPEVDTVQAEYRGSSLVERYVNPDAKDIPDLAQGTLDGLDAYYRYRVVNPRRFAP